MNLAEEYDRDYEVNGKPAVLTDVISVMKGTGPDRVCVVTRKLIVASTSEIVEQVEEIPSPAPVVEPAPAPAKKRLLGRSKSKGKKKARK